MKTLDKSLKNQVKPKHLRRLFCLALIFSLAFVGLGYRLVEIQYVNHQRYLAIAKENTKRRFFMEPKRGDILDINRNPMAVSVPVKKVVADPYFIGPFSNQVARAISPLLNIPVADLAQRLGPRSTTNQAGKRVPVRYVDLKSKLSLDDWERLRQAMTNLNVNVNEDQLTRKQKLIYRALRHKSIYAIDDQLRTYPNGSLAANVLGFTQALEQDFNDTTVNEIKGISGIEACFNEQMAGARGWRITEVDRRFQEIVAYREQKVEPRPGLDVVLTIDLVVQGILERELAEAMRTFTPISASAVVVRPDTGEILGLATLPSFDPSDPGQSPGEYLNNRVIMDRMEPGSTFKIVTIAAALNEGIVNLSTEFDCEQGAWFHAGHTLHDAGSHKFGLLSVEQILAKSSNIGTAKIALRLGEDRVYQYARAFGFGTKTGLTLGAENAGKVREVKDWDKLTLTRMPMGQGVAVTHLQMIMAMSAIANGGVLMRPMIVRQLVDKQGNIFAQFPPQRVAQAVSEETARLTTIALKSVVSNEGTAKAARLEYYSVAGKTGTAEKPDLVHGGYLDHENIHSFMGFLPADQPEICLSVVIDAPKVGRYASQTAAPTFGRIAERVARHLKIRPDKTTSTLLQPPRGADPEQGLATTGLLVP